LPTAEKIPPDFGGSCEAFLTEWACAGALGYSTAEVFRALSTIGRIWPEEVYRRASAPERGTAVAASTVDLGLLLASCEPVEGFGKVFRRLKNGERSAYSELVLTNGLQRLGHAVRLEPPLEGRVLDAKCVVHGHPIFFEVVSPERSEASLEEERVASAMITALRGRVSKCRVEIELRTPLVETSIPRLVTAIQKAPTGVWVVVDSAARARRIEVGQSLRPIFDGDGCQVVAGEQGTTQGDSTTIVSRWEASDARAKRVFAEEYHHFSNSVANALVVNVCAVSDGMKLWPAEIKRLLQPTRNRKVGAVVFFEQGSVGPPEAIRRRWRVVVNPHAHIEIPERLLSGFESLDESESYGLPPFGRT
jgi:hypothetical protein